jgi:integrase/recombinase XerC
MLPEYEKYVEYLNTAKSPHTARSYKAAIEPWLMHYNIQTIDDLKKIRQSGIYDYQDALVKIYKAKSSINARMRSISAFMGWLKQREHIRKNPVNRIKKLKEEQKKPAILTEEERIRVVNAHKRLDKKLLVAIMAYTGIRREEATNILVADIQNGRLLVHGKGAQEREIKLTPFVLDLIEKHLKRRKINSEYLFVSAKTRDKITSECVRLRVKKAYELAGINPDKIARLSAHSLRRTFACILWQNGTDVHTIQILLGHSKVEITIRYLRGANDEGADEAVMSQKHD